MDIFAQIKAFHDLVQSKRLSTGQIALWYALMYINNKCAWIDWFSAPNITLELNCGLSRNGIADARNVLKQKGVIDFRSNGTKPTSYKVKILYTMSEYVQDTMQDTVQDTVQDTGTLNIHRQDIDIDIKENNTDVLQKKAETVIELPLNDRSLYPITKEQSQEWAGLYPAVDVIQQLRNMRGWLDANPVKRKTKTGILRFINGWLAKEQNKGVGFSSAGGIPGYIDPKNAPSSQKNYDEEF